MCGKASILETYYRKKHTTFRTSHTNFLVYQIQHANTEMEHCLCKKFGVIVVLYSRKIGCCFWNSF